MCCTLVNAKWRLRQEIIECCLSINGTLFVCSYKFSNRYIVGDQSKFTVHVNYLIKQCFIDFDLGNPALRLRDVEPLFISTIKFFYLTLWTICNVLNDRK